MADSAATSNPAAAGPDPATAELQQLLLATAGTQDFRHEFAP